MNPTTVSALASGKFGEFPFNVQLYVCSFFKCFRLPTVIGMYANGFSLKSNSVILSNSNSWGGNTLMQLRARDNLVNDDQTFPHLVGNRSKRHSTNDNSTTLSQGQRINDSNDALKSLKDIEIILTLRQSSIIAKYSGQVV